jgi:hypothetical protein
VTCFAVMSEVHGKVKNPRFKLRTWGTLPILGRKRDGPEIGRRCCEFKGNEEFVVGGLFCPDHTAMASHPGFKILQDKFLLGNEFHAQSKEPAMSVDHLREGRFAEKISAVLANRNYNCDS